jgi:hypothetical protein
MPPRDGVELHYKMTVGKDTRWGQRQRRALKATLDKALPHQASWGDGDIHFVTPWFSLGGDQMLQVNFFEDKVVVCIVPGERVRSGRAFAA